MQLQAITTPAKAAQVSYSGQASGIEITGEQALRIETSPGGVEILDALVPKEKRWMVAIKVTIQEFDA